MTGNPVVTLPPTATALEAAQAMAKKKVGAILVQSGGKSAPGIFTERDLMARVVALGKDTGEVKIGDVMTKELFVAQPTEKAREIAREMQRRHIRHLPVEEDGQIVCVLSFRDLLRAQLEDTQVEAEAMAKYIQGEADASA